MAEASSFPDWSRRAAVVDCGTNLFTMLIATCQSTGWEEEIVLRRPVFIGQGGFRSRTILPDRFARGMDALRVLHQAAENYDVDTVRILGTSALRDAQNGATFAKQVHRELGWELEIIDGDAEAHLIHDGVAQTLGDATGPVLVMDIGGGSVEFIVSRKEGDAWKAVEWVSLDAGVGRLEEFGKPTDPIEQQGVDRYEAFLIETLAPVRSLIQAHSPLALVGSSGSFDTFADLLNVEADAPLKELGRDSLNALHQELINRSIEERLKMPGMSPARARLIPLSSMLLQNVLNDLPPTARVMRSPHALREGVMHGIWQHLCKEYGQ